MATGIKSVFLILVLFGISKQADGQEQRIEFCRHFRYCYYLSPLCGLLFQYFRCSQLETPTETPALACGFTSATGKASMYTMPRIVGGLNTMEGEFPWSVRLVDEQGYIGMCGGTIVNSRTVLTAAHCVSALADRAEDLKIGYGTVHRDDLAYIYASKVDVHPNYTENSNSDNDIAVVTLSEPLPLTTSRPSVCLPDQRRTYSAGVSCIVTGWGRIQERGFTFPDILQKAAVPLIPLSVCQAAYSNYSSLLVGERQLCAGYYVEGGVDACQGDSGGPLVCPEGDNWVLYGIVSIGNGCGRSRFPGIYTFIPQYVEWIRKMML